MKTLLRSLAVAYLVVMSFAGLTATTADEACEPKPGQMFSPCELLDTSHVDDMRPTLLKS